MKLCPKCKKSYPATREYFYRDTRTLSGLDCYCKQCHIKNSVQYNKTPHGRQLLNEYNRRYVQTEKGKIVHRRSSKKQYYKKKQAKK